METKSAFLDFVFPKSKTELQLDIIGPMSVTHSVLHLLHECVENYLDARYTLAKDVAGEVLNYTWEKLNTGHWKDVTIAWRRVYSYGSLIKAASLCGLCEEYKEEKLRQEHIQAALEACDLGLLMGSPILDNILSRLATTLQSISSSTSEYGANSGLMSGSGEHEVKKPSSKRQKTFHVPVLHPDQAIPRVICPALVPFQTQYMDKRQAVIIQGTMDHWPARSQRKWSLEYLKQVAGRRTVPIEIGSKYTDDDWSQKLITLSEFIDRYIHSHEEEEAGTSRGYLAQHPLFEQVPELKQDICIPDYCCLKDHILNEEEHKFPSIKPAISTTQSSQPGPSTKAPSNQPPFCAPKAKDHVLDEQEDHKSPSIKPAILTAKSSQPGPSDQAPSNLPPFCAPKAKDHILDEEEDEEVDINAWFGPQGTISPLHYDPKHNCLAQVVGKKYIRLYSEEMTKYVYPHEGYLLNNTSQVDVENPDDKQFPLFGKATYQECILQPGEMLYIPPKCWHYVRSLSTCFSVSFWWR